MKYTPENITELKSNQVFVFGSNTAGRHGAGAALTAYQEFGAKAGVGVGFTGSCYAIPTKDQYMNIRPLSAIRRDVLYFLLRAKSLPEVEFLVTKVGCGYAGYTPEEIGPMFYPKPDNVILPEEFKP